MQSWTLYVSFFLGERNIFILCITFFKHLGLVFDNQIETFDRYFIDGSILNFFIWINLYILRLHGIQMILQQKYDLLNFLLFS